MQQNLHFQYAAQRRGVFFLSRCHKMFPPLSNCGGDLIPPGQRLGLRRAGDRSRPSCHYGAWWLGLVFKFDKLTTMAFWMSWRALRGTNKQKIPDSPPPDIIHVFFVIILYFKMKEVFSIETPDGDWGWRPPRHQQEEQIRHGLCRKPEQVNSTEFKLENVLCSHLRHNHIDPYKG